RRVERIVRAGDADLAAGGRYVQGIRMDRVDLADGAAGRNRQRADHIVVVNAALAKLLPLLGRLMAPLVAVALSAPAWIAPLWPMALAVTFNVPPTFA